MKKFIIGLCVICMIFSQGVIAFAEVLVESENEPNDCMADADPFLVDNNYDDIWIYGIVSQSDKEDWYSLECDWSGQSLINLYTHDRDMDYDLYLYDNRGRCLASSNNGIGESEEIDYVYIQSGKIYYIKVEYVSGTEYKQPYDLRLSVRK